MSNLSADVLIIEDDIWLSEQFERTLQRAGCQTVSTSNALRAMELIDQSPPQVIILDMLLGGASELHGYCKNSCNTLYKHGLFDR